MCLKGGFLTQGLLNPGRTQDVFLNVNKVEQESPQILGVKWKWKGLACELFTVTQSATVHAC
jgi:hypothetical protein